MSPRGSTEAESRTHACAHSGHPRTCDCAAEHARWIAQDLGASAIVALFPDGGERSLFGASPRGTSQLTEPLPTASLDASRIPRALAIESHVHEVVRLTGRALLFHDLSGQLRLIRPSDFRTP